LIHKIVGLQRRRFQWSSLLLQFSYFQSFARDNAHVGLLPRTRKVNKLYLCIDPAYKKGYNVVVALYN
jgi:hypothetical protein